ncbi:MAG: RHS repeat-associated core domain-containing protein [Spirochaetales bacterium]|nr:RHS repeat-associated core domain-containing protein [Spirochaetales bacterium]
MICSYGMSVYADSRLYYFNARWYDPDTGRFITEDPVKDGLLWYAYANNNPMKFTDPTGLQTLPSFSDFLPYAIESSNSGWITIGKAINGDGRSQVVVGDAVVDTLRDGADTAGNVGDAAIGTAVVSAAVGAEPIAAAAATTSTIADGVSFGLNLTADTLESRFDPNQRFSLSSDTISSGTALLVDGAIGKALIPYDQASGKFFTKYRRAKDGVVGRITTNKRGRLGIAGSVGASRSLSAWAKDIVDQIRKQDDERDIPTQDSSRSSDHEERDKNAEKDDQSSSRRHGLGR